MGAERRHPAQRGGGVSVRAGKRVRGTPGAVGRDEARGRRTRPAGAQDSERFWWRACPRRPSERQGAGGSLVGERAGDGRHRGGGTLVARLRRRKRRGDAKGRGEIRGLLLGSRGPAALAGLPPVSKLLYGCGGAGVPELHWKSAIDERRVLGGALEERVADGELSISEAGDRRRGRVARERDTPVPAALIHATRLHCHRSPPTVLRAFRAPATPRW